MSSNFCRNKKLVCKALMLRDPDLKRLFHISVDATQIEVGAVLVQ